MTTTSQIEAAIRNFAIDVAFGDQAQRIKSGDALRTIITQAIAEARADGAREMREFAAQESRWGGDSGCDADAMTAHIRALPLPTKREPVRLTDEQIGAEMIRPGNETLSGFARAIETAVLAANGMTK